ncbi:Ger(x)C family spore germination protein [Bacillaceae bacterium SIJ1]|uniref:Ger(x)C family spore germination protein n=1 Tax=Litoribacterium kuwaitense TaxID=1398745 RepID=UPI0013EE0DCB|nr:Ger(x)C family spore germination protein [Litoribacterium kuwaitense]NGP45079.1 Ger(x)C family spore germination protein [Litoribacterium kuwaitense]
MKPLKIVLFCSCLLFILTGCWDAKEIGEVNYVTALGVDYADEQYIIYAQVLDFSSVAKQETGKAAQASPVFIGKGTGSTVHHAIDELTRTSQQPMNWSHVAAIVYSDNLLKAGMNQVQESLQKDGQLRYTSWMFGTKDPIEEILSVTGFFQLPPVYTMIYKPMDIFIENSYVKPLRMHSFVASYNEPGGSALLPSIRINTKSWQEAQKQTEPKKTYEINGAFPVYHGKSEEMLTYQDLLGLRWVENTARNTSAPIVQDDENIGSVDVFDPSATFEVIKKDGDFRFNIAVKAKGSLTDINHPLPTNDIEKLVEAQIETEIRQTFLHSLEKKADVYNLRNKLFRNGVPPEQLDEHTITADALDTISVEFYLETKGVTDR